jgi:DNA invertase Pin-like site-specific DNA recombinase
MVEAYPEKRLPGSSPGQAIGYARVSTFGQTLDSQLGQLRAAGCSRRNIHCEKVRGAPTHRRELNRMLGKLTPGDVQFRPLAEPWADTGTSTGCLILVVLGGLAGVERDLIRTRAAEGKSRPRSEESTWAAHRHSRKRPPGGARRALRCKNWRTAATAAFRPCAAPRNVVVKIRQMIPSPGADFPCSGLRR